MDGVLIHLHVFCPGPGVIAGERGVVNGELLSVAAAGVLCLPLVFVPL